MFTENGILKNEENTLIVNNENTNEIAITSNQGILHTLNELIVVECEFI